MKDEDFFHRYLNYTSGGETPAFFNRWSAIGMIGSWMGRQVHCKFGRSKLHTNQYIMLMGTAGTKKSTAIKTAKRLLNNAGYTFFAGEKISKEKYLLDLGTSQGLDSSGSILDSNLWGTEDTSDSRESWIVADEFNDFFANNILEFCSTLGVLWDYEGTYENRIKNGQSVVIPNPTISILGGNTQTAFAAAFPPEAVGQGFFSRVIAVYAKPTGIKVAWPKEPDEQETANLIEELVEMRNFHAGEIGYSPTARNLLTKIYETWRPIDDIRFASYGNRRHTHLLKLSLLHACSRRSSTIDEVDVIRANTVLHHAEHFMPDAFGEFGASRTSAQSHKVMQILENSNGMTSVEIWSQVQGDFDKIENFVACLSGLTHAKKIQHHGELLLPMKRQLKEVKDDTIDYDYLTPGEK